MKSVITSGTGALILTFGPKAAPHNGRFKKGNRLLFPEQEDYKSLRRVIDQRTRYYNQVRRHSTLDKKSPVQSLRERGQIHRRDASEISLRIGAKKGGGYPGGVTVSILSEPMKIGKLELRNRFVRSATYDGCADKTGQVSERQIMIFSELANSGSWIDCYGNYVYS